MSSIGNNAPVANIPAESLETIFFKTTSPIHKSADPNLMNLFCSKVNGEAEGHHQAIRLISHKIQSPQEHEALRTLELLEVCVQSCGRRFHQEIGKFRFLNEMIKLVSPKYLANHTSDKVKRKVIEILFSWTQIVPSEVKISEAYQMLKRQSIITEDPVYLNKCSMLPVVEKTKSIFDQDEEKSKILQRLLKSRKAEDLEQANALIKSLVKKDEEKIEKLSNRSNELEKIENNIRLLAEMLIHFNQSTVTEPEKETIIYLHEELQKLRPILFRLATESDDGDEGLGDILSTSDSLSRVLAQYDRLVRQDNSFKDDNVLSMFDEIVAHHHPVTPCRTLIDLAEHQNNSENANVRDKSAASELDDLFGPIETSKYSSETLSQLDDCLPIFAITPNNNNTTTTNQISSTSNVNDGDKSRKKGALFDDLQDLLVDTSTGQKLSSTKSSFESTNLNCNKTPLNEIFFPTLNLESIRPSTTNVSIQLKLIRETGVQCVLHFARDSPRVDLIPVVLSVTNTNTTNSITNFHFEAIESKNIRIKLQNPSGHDLPAFNPILPAKAVTQIILLSNPTKESVRFSYKLSYCLLGEQINECGDVSKGFPSSIDLI